MLNNGTNISKYTEFGDTLDRYNILSRSRKCLSTLSRVHVRARFFLDGIFILSSAIRDILEQLLYKRNQILILINLNWRRFRNFYILNIHVWKKLNNTTRFNRICYNLWYNKRGTAFYIKLRRKKMKKYFFSYFYIKLCRWENRVRKFVGHAYN